MFFGRLSFSVKLPVTTLALLQPDGPDQQLHR